jgi:hypothetical protein
MTPETDAEFDRLRFTVEPNLPAGITQPDEVVFGLRDFARKLELERNELHQVCQNAAELLNEVTQQHSSPISAEYNECDKSKCFWCEQAARIVEKFKSTNYQLRNENQN